MKKPLVKITVRVYQDDMDLLRMAYQHRGYNEVVRALVARHARRLKNAASVATPTPDAEKLTLEDLNI
jgi:hypothetical protein